MNNASIRILYPNENSCRSRYNRIVSEEHVLGLEKKVRELLNKVEPQVVGARIRRERQAQGLSIRELAALANLGTNSIVRLEAGTGFRPITLIKTCGALGIHVDRIAATSEADVVALHRRADDRWHELDSYGAGYLGGGDGRLSDEERQSAVEGTSRNPLMLLKSRLGTGRLLPTLIEVHNASTTRSHPGEEFVFALRGPVRVTVTEREYVLQTGESMEFWGSEPHSYSPLGDQPGLLLSIRANTERRSG